MTDGSIFEPCPYCERDNCEHLLLVVDETFRTAEGGLLMDSFNSRWTSLFDVYEDVDEADLFDQLIEEVDAFATATAFADQDSVPGLSSSYQVFYVASKVKANAALFLFRKGLPPRSEDSPPTPLARAIAGTDDLGTLRKIDEDLLFDPEIQKLEEAPHYKLSGELQLVVNEFVAKLPKPTSWAGSMGIGMKKSKPPEKVNRFFIIQKRVPSQEEIMRLWGAQ